MQSLFGPICFNTISIVMHEKILTSNLQTRWFTFNTNRLNIRGYLTYVLDSPAALCDISGRTHLKRIHKTLFSHRMQALRTPTVIAQPNMVTRTDNSAHLPKYSTFALTNAIIFRSSTQPILSADRGSHEGTRELVLQSEQGLHWECGKARNQEPCHEGTMRPVGEVAPRA
jgi:hypothetical protein